MALIGSDWHWNGSDNAILTCGCRSGIPESDVRAFAPGANAGPDSKYSYNPVYYIIGRNQSMTIVPPSKCTMGHSGMGRL